MSGLVCVSSLVIAVNVYCMDIGRGFTSGGQE